MYKLIVVAVLVACAWAADVRADAFCAAILLLFCWGFILTMSEQLERIFNRKR